MTVVLLLIAAVFDCSGGRQERQVCKRGEWCYVARAKASGSADAINIQVFNPAEPTRRKDLALKPTENL